MTKFKIPIVQLFSLIVYYGVLQYLPVSSFPILGHLSKKLRYLCCKHIFLEIGKNVNIERRANFGSGRMIKIGDNSGMGINCEIPNNTIIGKNVMMGPNVVILPRNHRYDRIDIPMIEQGFTDEKVSIIEDDVWIGRNVMITPGIHIGHGSIIAMGCVLTKNTPPMSIIGGCPGRLIKFRE